MSRFFVGQRVRVVSTNHSHNAWLIGSERRVARIDSNGDVTLDCHPLPDGTTWIRAYHLEPILHEGHRPCEEQFKRDLDRLLEREGVSA